ncbi:MAG: thiamine-phosphate kinase [Actinomycetes bacterium]
MRLSELGELGLLASLEQRGLITGVENDTAQLRDGLVVTQDALVEGVHFRLDWISWRALGQRAAAVNLSDLAASGATPEALVVTLAVPGTTAVADVCALYAGIAECGVPVVGGDTTSAPQVVLSITALGRSDRVPGRAGARPGDNLVVTGPLGGAGAAFRNGRYLAPPLRLAEGLRLGRHASAMLDISDGIAVDVSHLAGRSGVRCVVDLDAVPLAPGAAIDDLGFGEDYELLAAVADPDGFAVIGTVVEGAGVELLRDGIATALPGWEHFARDGGADDR